MARCNIFWRKGGSLKRSAPLSLSNGLGMATVRGTIPKGFAFEAATPDNWPGRE
jgi:hypothetical protein